MEDVQSWCFVKEHISGGCSNMMFYQGAHQWKMFNHDVLSRSTSVGDIQP